jgi:hypothetical protein
MATLPRKWQCSLANGNAPSQWQCSLAMATLPRYSNAPSQWQHASSRCATPFTAPPPDVRRGSASPQRLSERWGSAPGTGSARTRGVAPYYSLLAARRSLASHPAAEPNAPSTMQRLFSRAEISVEASVTCLTLQSVQRFNMVKSCRPSCRPVAFRKRWYRPCPPCRVESPGPPARTPRLSCPPCRERSP